MRNSRARATAIGAPAYSDQAAAHVDSDYAFLVGTLVDAETLAAAEHEADARGLDPHEVLLAEGLVTAEGYVAALADHLGAGNLEGEFAKTVLLDGTQGTPRELAVRIRTHRLRGERALLLDERGMRRSEEGRHSEARAHAAAFELAHRYPELSAATPLPRWQIFACAVLPVLAAIALLAAEASAAAMLATVMALPFTCVVVLRTLALAFVRETSSPVTAADWLGIPDKELPGYSVLVPLYDEAELVSDLLLALRKLDYPAAKLDVIVLLEASDRQTRAAFARADVPGFVRIVTVPDTVPRTKPKALNYGLAFARGDYVTVYDAEDLPDPNQLRRAVAAFREAQAGVCCLQARLNIYNVRGSWLTRQFALEYSALFDAILPALARLGLPVPLGGTSNHFPRRVLQQLGGWDAHNVTEDADLGIRIARLGGRSAVLDSTTWEEAPPTLAIWTSQRTRWLKGWMLTYLVHMREPRRLWRDLGAWGFFGFQVLMGGLILSALVHPLFYILLVWALLAGELLHAPEGTLHTALLLLGAFNLAAGYGSAMALAAAAAYRRGWRWLVPHALLMPVYWLLISLAAYRALFQLVRAPYHWNKTPHAPRRTQQGLAP
jgi:glycosyltransferase XagB